MKDRIKSLQKRYEGLKFITEPPILDIGGGDGKFLESQRIENALIIDLAKNKNPKYNYFEANISSKLSKELFQKNLKQSS